MTDLSGQYLGRYYLLEQLGEGGMAVVYKAHDTRLEREVAIKIIRSGAFAIDILGEVLKRFEREAKSLAKLSHPNIVKVYDYGEHEGSPYLVMEFLPGGTLKKLLGRPIAWREAVRIMLPVARGVEYAHQRGILHRDIKPANVLITENKEPMLSDFGIAKLFEGEQITALTELGRIIGTPEYMSPEQWTGITSPQSDLYSLGIVLYEMVTGRKPYVADTPAGILLKQANEPLPSPRNFAVELPEELEAVLIKALAKEPSDRYRDVKAFVAALEDLHQATAVHSPVYTPTEETNRTTRSKSDASIFTQTASTGDETNLPVTKSETQNVVETPVLSTAETKLTKRRLRLSPKTIVTVSGAIVMVTVVVCFLAVGKWFSSLLAAKESATATITLTFPAATPSQIIVPSQTPIDATEMPSVPTEIIVPTLPDLPGVIGGADKIAFIANQEVWLMNVDGSDFKQLTTDSAVKSDLHWLPDGKRLVFLGGADPKSNKTIRYLDLNADAEVVNILTTFASENSSVTAFQVSHDGGQVMIALTNDIWIVPFDFDVFKKITNRNELTSMNGACFVSAENGRRVREVRWSLDDEMVAWLNYGIYDPDPTLWAEQLTVFDIENCNLINRGTFPGALFTPKGYNNRQLLDFDWDGRNLFVFNTVVRNGGWGYLYIYDQGTHKPTLLFEKDCCFRDARWSPDGTYLFFEFQNVEDGDKSQATLYYIPVDMELRSGGKSITDFTPIPLPEGFSFKNVREGAQAALHPAR